MGARPLYLALALILGIGRGDIATVNVEVNRSITYMEDEHQYGEADKWVASPASGFGDCEDYALTKRDRLLALGTKTQDLRIVLGYTWTGARHAVLYVRDSNGQWWVLDNTSSRLGTPGRTQFRPDLNGAYGPPPP